MIISLIIVTRSSPTSSADESLPQPLEDGSTYSSICDPCRILRYIPIRPHLDWPLITCLVERWRLETHTFHVPVGEMTITLQDVAIILGLRIDGPTVTGTCMLDVAQLCGELLGVTPPTDALRGLTISIRWLCQQLSTPGPDADEVALEQSARGFLLALIGCFLFPDKKGSMFTCAFSRYSVI